jgi:hypothetical protein
VKIRGLLCVVLLGCAWRACPEAALTVGASGESSLIDPVSAGIEPFLKGACSLTVPLSDRASALADAAVRLGYGWPGQGLTWFGFAAADISWRAGQFFAMLGASATAEGDATGSLPSLEAATDIEISLDLSRLTLSFIPTMRVRAGDEQGLGVDGVLSSILAAGDAAVVRARIQGGLEWPEAGLPEWFAGAGLGASWYPGMPIVASIDAAALRRVSSNSTVVTIDGAPVTVPNADSYLELSVLPEISAQLGRSLTLGLSVPTVLRLMDHGAVEGGVLIAQPEWLLTCGPTATLRLEASPSVSLKATLGGDLAFSNSSFREKRVAYLTLEAVLSLAQPR